MRQVTLLPCDHFVADEGTLARTICVAQDAAATEPERVLLVGIVPDAPDPEYGWILPARRPGGTQHIRSFIEKPDVASATALMRAGAVWNSFLIVASGAALLDLYQRRLPALLEAFLAAQPHSHSEVAASLYRGLVASDFSRDLLQGAEPSLGLHVAPACGWTDLGTPERVRRWAATHRQHRGTPPLQQCTRPDICVLGERVIVRVVYPCSLSLVLRNRRCPWSVPPTTSLIKQVPTLEPIT